MFEDYENDPLEQIELLVSREFKKYSEEQHSETSYHIAITEDPVSETVEFRVEDYLEDSLGFKATLETPITGDGAKIGTLEINHNYGQEEIFDDFISYFDEQVPWEELGEGMFRIK